MSRVIRHLAVPVASLLLAGCAGAESAMGVPTAMAAHEICSAVFVSRLDGDRAFAATVAPRLGPLKPLLRKHIDPVGRSVTASIGPIAARRAVYDETFGCIVHQGATRLPAAKITVSPAPSVLAVAPALAPQPAALAEALDLAADTPRGDFDQMVRVVNAAVEWAGSPGA